MNQSSDRFVPLEGTVNFREVGGYPAATGTTKWRTLYRSDALGYLTDSDRDELRDRGLAIVLDVRDDAEVMSLPDALGTLPARVVHDPILTGSVASFVQQGAGLATLYEYMADHAGAGIARAVGVIADAAGAPLVVHCTAGKDRTGVIIAFALLAAGVDRESVLSDYEQTAHNLAGAWAEQMLARVRSYGAEITPSLHELITGSPRSALIDVIEHVESQHGSVAQYLRANGLSQIQLDALVAALIE